MIRIEHFFTNNCTSNSHVNKILGFLCDFFLKKKIIF